MNQTLPEQALVGRPGVPPTKAAPAASAGFQNRAILDQLTSPEEQRAYAQDTAMLAATNAVLRAMQERGISKSDVAARIGRSRSHVSQVLSGSRNMTVATLADLLWACDLEVSDLAVGPLGQSTVSREQMDVHLDRSFCRVVSGSTDYGRATSIRSTSLTLLTFSFTGGRRGGFVGA